MPEIRPSSSATDKTPPAQEALVFIFQAKGVKSYRILKDRVVIGTIVSSDVRLTGEGIAPIHAVIERKLEQDVREGIARIYDMASETGVLINGKKEVVRDLQEGDEIQIAHVKFKVFTDLGLASSQVVEKEDITALLLEKPEDVQEIFDYPPKTEQALEVVMSWHDTILGVEHFRRNEEIQLHVPLTLGSRGRVFVRKQGSQFALTGDPAFKGVIQQSGKITDYRSHSGGVVLGPKDFVKISLGEVDFYLSTSPAPPRLKPQKFWERDALLFRILGTSLVLTTALIIAMLRMEVPKNVEVEQLPDRIATILYQPEKYSMPRAIIQQTPAPRPTEKPTVKSTEMPAATTAPKITDLDLTKKGQKPNKIIQNVVKHAGPKQPKQNEGQEGRGKRAKGPEGTRGSKTSKLGKIEPQDIAKRPGLKPAEGRGGMKSQVPSQGNVEFLKDASSKIQNLLGGSLSRLGKEGGKLQGVGNFMTVGTSGHALSGTGTGGGGTSELVGGLSDKGTGMGRVGTGKGAAGRGSDILGGRTQVLIRSDGPEEAVVMGAIDAEAVEAALLAHRDQFRFCYEKEINAGKPRLSGRISTSFIIGRNGRVNQTYIVSTTLNDAKTETCVLRVIRTIDFPIPRGGGIVRVAYPFKFSPGG